MTRISLALITTLAMLTACQPGAQTPTSPSASAGPNAPAPVAAAGLDLAQGFNFQTSNPASAGYLHGFKFGGTQLVADLSVPQPSGGEQSVVAVLTQVGWDGQPTSPMHLKGLISGTNREMLKTMTANAPVTMSLSTWGMDGRTPYRSFGSESATLTAVSGPLTVADTPNASAPKPSMFDFAVELKPGPGQQTLITATGSAGTAKKAWGS